MKRRVIALLLSLTLGLMPAMSAQASDFLNDPEDAVEQEVTVVQSEEVEIPVVLEETPETQNPGEVEEETDDFYTETEMSEVPAPVPEEQETPEEEIESDDFLADADLAVNMEGWEERTVDGEHKYLYAKGTQDENGNTEYYTKEDGIVTIQEKLYYFDENGYMVTGRTEYEGKYLFFMSADRATLNEGAVGDPNPSNSDLGQQQKGYWYWTGKTFEYYTGAGPYASVSELRASKQKSGTWVGYFKIDGSYYALKDDGTPRTSDYEITDGNKPGLYYFYPKKNEKGYPGAMAVSTWVKIVNSNGTRWRYYNSSGRTTLGIKAAKLDSTIDPSVGNGLWLLSNGGYLYTSAVMRKAADGYTYACNASGKVYKDKIVTYNNIRYYVDKNGRLVSWTNSWHWIASYQNRPYYFGKTAGAIQEQTGWVRIGTKSSYKWYYFSAKGNATTEGWTNDYYFDSKCALLTGMQTIDGKTYIFRVSDYENHNGKVYKSRLVTYNDKKYYAGEDGVLVTKKWVTYNGASYYCKEDGTIAVSQYIKKGTGYGYVDSTGKFITGWVIVDANANKIRYINTKALGYVKNDYRVIDGVRYYFDSNGYRVSDLTSYYPTNWRDDPVLVKVHNGSYAPYYLETDKANGVITVYTDSGKSIPVRTIRTSVGNPTSLTISGTFTLTRSLRWQPLMGPSWGQYGTHVVNGIFIHSVACNSANCYNLPASAYDMLGSPASHGCMRVCVADAKWVYDNCSGARIKVFYGNYQSQECFKGPLGRKPLVPRYGAGNFDPTDPAV